MLKSASKLIINKILLEFLGNIKNLPKLTKLIAKLTRILIINKFLGSPSVRSIKHGSNRFTSTGKEESSIKYQTAK